MKTLFKIFLIIIFINAFLCAEEDNTLFKNDILNPTERKFLETNPRITIAVFEFWSKFSYKNKEGKYIGYHIDFLKIVNNNLKMNFIIKEYPTWTAAYNAAKDGKVDGILGLYWSKEREKQFLYSPSYYYSPTHIVVRKDDNSIKSMNDVKNKTVVSVKDSLIIPFFKKKYPSINVILAIKPIDRFAKVQNKEGDVVFANDVTNAILKKYNLKISNSIFFESGKFSMGTHIKNKTLAGIMRKAVLSLSKEQKNYLTNTWIKEKKIKKEIKVIISKTNEPYSFQNSFLKGIEYDLIEFIFTKLKIKIKKAQKNIFGNIYEEFNKNKDFDVALPLKKENNHFHYSKDFIFFENVAITRYEDNIVINNISALKDKNISSFHSSKKYLGNEFLKAVEKNKNFIEYKSQEKQIKDFLTNKKRVLIIDKNIFKWYLKKFSQNDISQYKFDPIFKEKNNYQVAFRNKALRDLFDIELQKIKDSGKYQEIINNYIKYDINSKKKLSIFLSSLLGKSIYDNNTTDTKAISTILLSRPYIDKFQVFNKVGDIIYSSKKIEKKVFLEEKSFYDVFFKPLEVGFIRIYFNEEKLKKSISKNKLIPDIKLFKGLNSFSHIKSIYQRFQYLTNKIKFTEKELKYMKDNPIISYAESNWKPFVFLDKNNNDEGIITEYKNIIESKTSLRFKHIKSIDHSSWGNIIESFEKKELDILLSYNPSELNPIKGLTSKSYETFNYVIVSKENADFIDNLSDLNYKTIALARDFSLKRFLEKFHPNIKIFQAKNGEEAFKLISSNKIYATIEHYAIATYKIKNIHSKLKIAGQLEKKYSHHFLVQENNPILLSILNKVIDTISLDQKNKIRNKWIHPSTKTIIDYTLVYQLLAVFILILIIIFFFMRKLNKTKNLIDAEKKNLETLFMDIQDAVILAKDGRYINVNNSLLTLFNIKNKKDFLDQEPGSMAPKYQVNGELSHNEMRKYLDIAYQKGNVRFQWQSRRTSGEILWIEFVVSKVKYFNEDILHMLCRDITKTKLLELELKEQKNIFETLFNDSADGVALIKDGLLVDCNNAVLSMFGFKNKSELFSLSFSDISPLYQENNKKSSKEAKLKMIDSVKYGSNRFEWIHKKVTGEIFWAEIVLSHIKINNENIIHVVLRNISATKRLQEQIKNRTNDLEYSNQELENSNEELQKTILNLKQTQEQLVASEKMASLGGLVAGVAHEINTPVGIGLTGISHLEGLTETINKQYKKDIMSQNDFEEYLLTSKDLSNLIHKNLQKAASLVRSFKQVAVDQSSEEKRVFNLKVYMDEILQSIHSVTKKADVQIDVLCEKDIVINSYAGEYSQIITNLIMNSMVHAFKKKEKGKIIIRIEQNKDELIIVYTDNGKGIKKENLHKIFDPFFTTNRNNGGSGLGLNIIYNIITSRFKGTIICKSIENEGVEFFIHLKV